MVAPPRFNGVSPTFETTRSYEPTDVFALPRGDDVAVESYGEACSLRLYGERGCVRVRRFDYLTFLTEEEARHAFMRLWREVELPEPPAEIERAAKQWLSSSRERPPIKSVHIDSSDQS